MAARVSERPLPLPVLPLALSLSLYTAATIIGLLPPVNLLIPGVRIAVETAGAIISVLTAALAFVQYEADRLRSWLLIAIAFVTSAANQFLFGVIAAPPGPLIVYLRTTGRLAVALLLLSAALQPGARLLARRPLAAGFARAAATLAVVAVAQVGLWLAREGLPDLRPAGSIPSLRGGGVAPLLAIPSVISAALILTSALLFLRPQALLRATWLVPALLLGGFSHLHYALSPTLFTDQISNGDLLRLGFLAVLLFGVVGAIRQGRLAERRRSLQMARAYVDERQHARELEDLDRAKQELLAIVSHELMHPVAAIRGFALTLERRWDELEEATRLEIVGHIAEQSERLRRLAEEGGAALSTNLERLDVVPEPQDVRDLLEEAARMAPELAGRLEIRVRDGAVETFALADRARVQQVFGNLLSNAAKFSPADSPVELGADAVDREIRFWVRDQGPGVDPADRAKLFEPFARLAASDGKPGTGLGLYIARRIVEAHGGRLWVESRAWEGATFAFTVLSAEAAV
ncbi:MAG TPA: ATP-binding protein [Actinomycetota bacterium]|nr:ATP-binding protein [Actinomycetota bacterium]